MMHRKWEELAILDLYEEISETEKAKLDRHMLSCPRCAAFRRSLAGLLAGHTSRDAADLDAALREASSEVHQVLVHENKVRAWHWMPRSGEVLRRVVSVPVYAMTVMVVLMLGFGGTAVYLYVQGRSSTGEKGRSGTGGEGPILAELLSADRNDITLDNLQFLPAEGNPGDISISFDSMRRYQLKGSLADAGFREVLAIALASSSNAGVRLKTVRMLDEVVTAKPDTAIKHALVRAVRTDGNAGVRREALLALGKLSFDDEIKSTFLYTLQNDLNPGMRVAAIDCLSEKQRPAGPSSPGTTKVDPDLLNLLQQKSSSDPNQYVRLKAANMLKELKDL